MPIADPKKIPHAAIAAAREAKNTPSNRYADRAAELRATLANRDEAMSFLTLPEWPLCAGRLQHGDGNPFACEKPREHANNHSAVVDGSTIEWDDNGATVVHEPAHSRVAKIPTNAGSFTLRRLVNEKGQTIDPIEALLDYARAVERGRVAAEDARDRITKTHGEKSLAADAARTVYNIFRTPFLGYTDALSQLIGKNVGDTATGEVRPADAIGAPTPAENPHIVDAANTPPEKKRRVSAAKKTRAKHPRTTKRGR